MSLLKFATTVSRTDLGRRITINTVKLKSQRCHRGIQSSSVKSTFPTTATTVFKIVGGGLVLGTALATKYLYDEVGGGENNGLRNLLRSASFYSLAIPKYVEYRFHMIWNSSEKTWEDLHKRTSQAGLDKILKLRGFYIKSGQLCAANIGNAFPKIWQDTMSVLQDQCPYESFPVIQSILESEYPNQTLSSIFSYIDPNPIGAASIGQVHRATLAKDGTRVVVKIMYPDVESVFRGDVRTIKMFAQVAQPVHVPPLVEIEKQFMTEFDYVKEAKQMDVIRTNLIRAGLSNGKMSVTVPRSYPELCTKRVLVMEELNGEKLAVGLRRDLERHAHRAGMTLDQFLIEQEEDRKDLRSRKMVKKGPTAKEYDSYIKLLNGKRKLSNFGAMMYNYGVVWWLPGGQRREYVGRDMLPINHAKLVDDLIYVHGHEVLVDGFFNGDPHPGNILLLGTKEGKPRLGLIDYGQVKKLKKEDRLLMCQIIIALADDNRSEITRLMKQAGYKSKKMDSDIIYKYAKVSYDEDNDELTQGLHIQMFMEELQHRDPIETLPTELVMVGRTSIMLRGLAHALHQSRSVAKAWKPIAEQVLRKEGLL